MIQKYVALTIAVITSFREVSAQYQLTRVIEGTPTSIDRYPIIAQLLLDSWGDQHFVQHCAGVIVTARHVISTAHCFQYNTNTGRNYALPKYWKVRVGSSYRTHGGVIHSLKSIIPHDDFDSHYYTNDIAVVVVAKPFTFNNNVRQSTIIKQYVDIKPNSICTLIGWGVLERQPEPDGPMAIRPTQRESPHYKIYITHQSPFENLSTSISTRTNHKANVSGSQPDQLQYTTMFTIDQNVCRSRYNAIGAMIADSMLCAGRIDLGGPDGCYGDSGGPLIYKGLVVGLVSYGYSCGHRYYPGVYTKISRYTDWILNTVYANK